MIYDVQFNYPIVNAAPMIYEGLVDASRPTQPIPQVLSDIQSILAERAREGSSDSLIRSRQPWSEQGIQAFLERLAEEIELHNTKVIRSGRPVPQSGQWLCYEDHTHSVFLSKGEIAPEVKAGGNIWVLAANNPNPTARERVLLDFTENFIPNALHGIRYQDPEVYAEATLKRLASGADEQTLADLAAVLEQLLQIPASPLLDDITRASGFDWTADELRWTFLQKFVGGMIRRLGERQKNRMLRPRLIYKVA